MEQGVKSMLRRRYRRIVWFFASWIARLFWWEVLLPRLGLGGLSRRTQPERLRQAARSFRLLAVSMGGVMIKVGQFLSARLDTLPREVIAELSGLQDEVPAEPFTSVRQVVEAEFSAPLEQLFSAFEPLPLASASIGQVHRARLRIPDENGTGERAMDVVVKVQRPDIPEIVETDLRALRMVANWLRRYQPLRKRANVPALVEEFSRSLHEEIDYLTEGHHAETFAADFKDYPGVCVPRVYWERTTRRVLTLEDVWAIKIGDYPALEQAGIPRADVAKRLFDTYLKQIFEDRFFHADPHPGNLFIYPRPPLAPGEPVPWDLVFVDFGMMGQISPRQFAGLRELLFGIGLHDASRAVKAYQMLDVLLPGTNTEALERASARVFDRLWGKSTQEMMNISPEEAEDFAREFGDLLYEMPFQLPENLILMGRCLGILSGMCTGLDPDFNAWAGMAPYAQKLMQAEGVQGRNWLNEIGNWVRVLIGLPGRAETFFQRVEQGRLVVRVPDLTEHIVHLEKSVNRLVAAIILAAFLMAGVQLESAGRSVPAYVMGGAALITLIWILLG